MGRYAQLPSLGLFSLSTASLQGPAKRDCEAQQVHQSYL